MRTATTQTAFDNTPACVLNDVFSGPMPGDFVRVVDTLDRSVPVGSLGVILGTKNNEKDDYDICFNPVPAPWGGKVTDTAITAAGGSIFPMVDTEMLKPTSEVIIRHFYTKSPMIHQVPVCVKVWEIDLCAYERSGCRLAFLNRAVGQRARSFFN